MFYLHHYFNPDFSHVSLSPHENIDGSFDYRYLGYVQNVVAGQLLAEIMPLENFPENRRDARFIYSTKHLPCGPNCLPHPTNPDKLVAGCNGFVFYHNGLIFVKKLLNIRGNLGFHTGNVFFVGDMAIHGDVQTGFAARATNILVKGHVESAKLQALGDIVCLGGVKGANVSGEEVIRGSKAEESEEQPLPSALIDAGGTIRLPFCEHVQLRAKGNLIIDNSCLHSTIYVGGNLVVKGRMQGGATYANGYVYVADQLGSDYSATTKIMMGYDPFNFLMLQKLDTRIRYLTSKAIYFEKQVARNGVMRQEFEPRLELAQRKLAVAHERRNELWKKFSVDEESASACRVIVPGKVMPGCEIGIGSAYLKVTEEMSDVCFYLQGGEVVIGASSLYSVHAVPTP